MDDFHHPLYQLTYQKANELRELLLPVEHDPEDHCQHLSVHLCVDLTSSILTYDITGCCQNLESVIEQIIHRLDHTSYVDFKVKLNYTFRQRIEQIVNRKEENILR